MKCSEGIQVCLHGKDPLQRYKSSSVCFIRHWRLLNTKGLCDLGCGTFPFVYVILELGGNLPSVSKVVKQIT